MRKNYMDALNSIVKPPIETRAHRRNLLRDILLYAVNNVSSYSAIRRGANLSDFPVVNKQDILERYEEFTVLPEKIPGQEGALHVQRTSGSTGVPFRIPQDSNCRVRRIATIKAANELIGFRAFMPLMHLRSVKHYWDFDGEFIWRKDLRILYADNANLSEEKLARIVKAVNDYHIRFIRGYVTAMDEITRYAVEHGVQFSCRPTFIAGGEMLTDQLRNRIVNDLGCDVVSQYANEENGVLGQAELNACGRDFKLYLANCYVEILKLDSDEPVGDNELGRIVLTDYFNHALPMIRYEIGDLAMVGERSEDGEVLSLKKLAGRKTDMIYRTNGTIVDFHNSISPEIFNNPSVLQWQFIQSGAKEYKLIITMRDRSIVNLKDRFIELIRDVLGKDAVVDVVFVDDVPVLSSGKRKIVVQLWKK